MKAADNFCILRLYLPGLLVSVFLCPAFLQALTGLAPESGYLAASCNAGRCSDGFELRYVMSPALCRPVPKLLEASRSRLRLIETALHKLPDYRPSGVFKLRNLPPEPGSDRAGSAGPCLGSCRTSEPGEFEVGTADGARMWLMQVSKTPAREALAELRQAAVRKVEAGARDEQASQEKLNKSGLVSLCD